MAAKKKRAKIASKAKLAEPVGRVTFLDKSYPLTSVMGMPPESERAPIVITDRGRLLGVSQRFVAETTYRFDLEAGIPDNMNGIAADPQMAAARLEQALIDRFVRLGRALGYTVTR